MALTTFVLCVFVLAETDGGGTLLGWVRLLCGLLCAYSCVRIVAAFSFREVAPPVRRDQRVASLDTRIGMVMDEVMDDDDLSGLVRQNTRGACRKLACKVGCEIRLDLGNPDATRADYKVALERAGRWWEEHKTDLNLRPSWRQEFMNVAAAVALVPTGEELRAYDVVTSQEAHVRREALGERFMRVERQGLLYDVARWFGFTPHVEVSTGLRSVKPLA